MGKKTTKRGSGAKTPVRRSVDPYEEAAAKARAPVEDFRLWMLRRARGYGSKQWSAWENWWRPIPAKYVIQFIHERNQPTEAASAAQRG